jgi:site-specific recombinase XerD
MNQEEKIKDFKLWVEEHRDANTAKTYYQMLLRLKNRNLPLPSLEMNENEAIEASINIFEFIPENLMRATIRKYINYLYIRGESYLWEKEGAKKISFMRKRNNILSNIELPLNICEKKVDIAAVYVPAEFFYTLLTKVEDQEEHALTLSLYDFGTRIREELDNTVKSIDMDHKTFYVPKEISKSNKDRVIDIRIPETLKELNQICQGKDKEDPIFEVKYLSYYLHLKKYSKQTIKELNKPEYDYLKDLSPHWLRHTRITDLAPIMELGALQRRSGHRNPEGTNNYMAVARSIHPITLEAYLMKNNLRL